MLHTPSMSSQHTQSKTIIMQYLLRQLHNTFLPQESLLPLPVFPSCLAYFYKPLKHYLSIVALVHQDAAGGAQGFSIPRGVHN